MANVIDGNSKSGNSTGGNSGGGNSLHGQNAGYDTAAWQVPSVSRRSRDNRADGAMTPDPRPEVPTRVTTAALDRRDV